MAECHLILMREEFGDRYAFYDQSFEDKVYDIVSALLEECTVVNVQHNSSDSDTTEEPAVSESSECQRPALFSSSMDSD